ncbi:MAG: hypothetical protein Q9193_005994 [Seirophora villosa]
MGDIPGVIYAIAILFSLLAIAATVLRFYARSIKKVGISWDDYAIIPALKVFTIATAITMIIGAAIGDLGRHTDVMLVQNMEGQVAPMPILTHRTVVFQQTVYTTSLTQVLTFGFTKLAVLLFYQRIFQGKWFHRAVWLMIGVDFIWTVTFFFANLLQCYPIEINWTGVVIVRVFLSSPPSPSHAKVCIVSSPTELSQLQIWAMQMSIRRKLAVCGIFLLGFMTVAAGLAKLVVVYNILYVVDNDSGLDPNSPVLDISWLQTSFVYWPMIESGVGIVGACLPLLRPLFAGAATRGFMRDLQSVDIPTSERSDTLWDKSGISGPMSEGWNSSVSTVRWGSDSMPAGDALREKRLPSLPTSSLNMLRDAPSEGPWMKGPRVRHDMI